MSIALDFRKATVFGGSGFIGRHIVRELARQGVVVRAAVRDPEAALFLKPMGNVGQVAPIYADVRDEASVRAAVDGADLVVNAISLYAESRRARFGDMHVRGAENVARLSREAGATRLIHMSGLGVKKESRSAFVRARAHGDERVLEAFPDATILRPSVVFGPGDHFFSKLAQMSRYLPVLPLPAGGAQKMQPVYVGDVADAAIAALSEPKSRGAAYELGGPQVYTYRELLEIILRETNRKRILLPVPGPILATMAFFMEFLPSPPLTRDQLKFIGEDNVVAEKTKTLEAFGVAPTALEAVLPTYLDAFRRGGRFKRESLI